MCTRATEELIVCNICSLASRAEYEKIKCTENIELRNNNNFSPELSKKAMLIHFKSTN